MLKKADEKLYMKIANSKRNSLHNLVV